MDDVSTVEELMRELGYDDDGRVRAAVGRAFPDHLKKQSMGPTLAGGGQLRAQGRQPEALKILIPASRDEGAVRARDGRHE